MILNIKIKFCFNLKYILINYFNEIICNTKQYIEINFIFLI